MIICGDFDTSGLWDKTDPACEDYIGEPLTDDLRRSIEEQLGYQLPDSYAGLMRIQNGGVLAKKRYRTDKLQISVTHIYGINRSKRYSLGGILVHLNGFTARNPKTGEPIRVPAKSYHTGSQYWIQRGYPPIGVYFAGTEAAGHNMVCLDYRTCGPEGEPQVVLVTEETGYGIDVLAANFEAFIRGLGAPGQLAG
jgi:hypothetical protein